MLYHWKVSGKSETCNISEIKHQLKISETPGTQPNGTEIPSQKFLDIWVYLRRLILF